MNAPLPPDRHRPETGRPPAGTDRPVPTFLAHDEPASAPAGTGTPAPTSAGEPGRTLSRGNGRRRAVIVATAAVAAVLAASAAFVWWSGLLGHTDAPPLAAPPDPCGLLTKQQVTLLIGPFETTHPSDPTRCEWDTQISHFPQYGITVDTNIQYANGSESAASMAHRAFVATYRLKESNSDEKYRSIGSVGDEAVTENDGKTYEIYFRSGNANIGVTLTIDYGTAPPHRLPDDVLRAARWMEKALRPDRG